MVRSLTSSASASFTAVSLSDAACNCLRTSSLLSRAISTLGSPTRGKSSCFIPAIAEDSSSADCFITSLTCSICASTWVRSLACTVTNFAFGTYCHAMTPYRFWPSDWSMCRDFARRLQRACRDCPQQLCTCLAWRSVHWRTQPGCDSHPHSHHHLWLARVLHSAGGSRFQSATPDHLLHCGAFPTNIAIARPRPACGYRLDYSAGHWVNHLEPYLCLSTSLE